MFSRGGWNGSNVYTGDHSLAWPRAQSCATAFRFAREFPSSWPASAYRDKDIAGISRYAMMV